MLRSLFLLFPSSVVPPSIFVRNVLHTHFVRVSIFSLSLRIPLQHRDSYVGIAACKQIILTFFFRVLDSGTVWVLGHRFTTFRSLGGQTKNTSSCFCIFLKDISTSAKILLGWCGISQPYRCNSCYFFVRDLFVHALIPHVQLPDHVHPRSDEVA